METSALALIRSYGVTDQEIISEFGSLDPNQITLAANVILETENQIDQGRALSMFAEDDFIASFWQGVGITTANAQGDTVGGCLADAIGIVAAFEIIEEGVAGLGKKGVLKIIKKVGGRFLGPIGAALAAYDFIDCMGWI